MMERLLHLKIPLITVLDGAKPKDCALLLADTQWSLAEHLVTVLRPVERAATVLSGQYPLLSLVYPVVSG